MSLPRKNNYKINEETLRKAVKDSISISEVFQKIGICNTGTAYKTLKRRFIDLKIDTSHFKGQGYLKDKKHNWTAKIPLKDILVKNSSYVSIPSLKRRIINEGLLQLKCSECQLGPQWNNKPLSLQLDHINGINDDHRLENLRLLCPNCHSQTDTFAGRNKLVPKKGVEPLCPKALEFEASVSASSTTSA